MKKKTFVILMAAILCLGIATGVAAAYNQTISATLNRTITIMFNGTEQTFKDVTGKVVYPISYEGTTYLPVRAVSGLVDLAVDYDGATETVILGSSEKQPTAVTSLPATKGTEYSSIIRDKEELKIVGDSATEQYSTGILWHQWNGAASYSKARAMVFDVNGYTSLTFTVYSDSDSYARVYDEEGGVLATYDVKAGSIMTKTIDITGEDKIAFGSDGMKYGENGYVKFLDATVQ